MKCCASGYRAKIARAAYIAAGSLVAAVVSPEVLLVLKVVRRGLGFGWVGVGVHRKM